LVVIAYWGLREAAREIARRPEPTEPLRERLHDFKEEWQRAVAPPPVVYLPEPTGHYTYTPQTPPPSSRPVTETYGVEPFLSDKLNPVFAKDMRSGLLGKLNYLLRFTYIVTVGSELLLLLLVLGNTSPQGLNALFAGWAKLHLLLLMTAGAWFGSRGLAPEREQQTLPQLLTTPLTPATIVQGKMMSVMVHTFYVFIMAVPLVLLLPSLGEMPWRTAISFILLELALGAFAAAWGLYCSLQFVTVRRALGFALGGVLALMLVAPLLADTVSGAIGSAPEGMDRVLFVAAAVGDWLLPYRALAHALNPANVAAMNLTPALGGMYHAISFESASLAATVLIYSVITLALLVLTSRAFRQYAQTV
ncbi:MAG: ABC transporter permease subunit, partial [Armatimonadota bacterium]|nr:ABC transporter permease subunit [Armatimonadota bacterium]